MSESAVSQKKREGLDKELIRLIGYPPVCLLAGAIIGVSASFVIYLVQCFDFSKDLMPQLDSGADHLFPQLRALILPSLFNGALAGLAVGLLGRKLKTSWQRFLASLAIGLIFYILAALIFRSITNISFFNALDYLRFFVFELSLAGILVGLLVALLPQSEKID